MQMMMISSDNITLHLRLRLQLFFLKLLQSKNKLLEDTNSSKLLKKKTEKSTQSAEIEVL